MLANYIHTNNKTTADDTLVEKIHAEKPKTTGIANLHITKHTFSNFASKLCKQFALPFVYIFSWACVK